MRKCTVFLLALTFILVSFTRPDKEFRVFQFPKDQIPRIDGEFSDWDMVPISYSIGLEELRDMDNLPGTNLDPEDYDISVKVGWVKNINKLYFYVEASDDYWDFNDPALSQDIIELVVDGDISGGPFIKYQNENINKVPLTDLHFKGHGAHAQNYHIFTPVQNKDWAMVWGNNSWIKDFPYANAAYSYDFKHGESGKLRMEFWITPFDHASINGFQDSKVSELKENEIIGLSWAIMDYDGREYCESFPTLSHDNRMISNASYFCAFRLMPLMERYQKDIEADWTFIEIDRNQRWFQFLDNSAGIIDSWQWDFGDGTFSDEKNPNHRYEKAGEWTVILTVKGAAGESIRSKVWDVVSR